MTHRIVIATGNRGKLAEFEKLFAGREIEIVAQQKFSVPEAIEDGLSFVENAIIKARNACEHTGLAAIADDSGLEVDALMGAPGIYSSRYSADVHGDDVCDQTNNDKLLHALEGIDDAARGARFVCVLVFMRHAHDPTPVIAVGEWRGTILRTTRGQQGFGYDPLFYVGEYQQTSAELDRDIKNTVSHRAQAMKGLFEQLRGQLQMN